MAGRRQYNAEFKAKVLLEVLSGEKTPSDVCREHKLNINVLNRWRKELVEQAPTIFERAEITRSQVLPGSGIPAALPLVLAGGRASQCAFPGGA